MLSDREISNIANELLAEYGLESWAFSILDEHPSIEGVAGFTYFDTNRVEIYRELWPTCDTNKIEVVRHEIAHAITGHGNHDSEWWEILMRVGGTGAWLDENGQPEPWSWTVAKLQQMA